MKEREINQTEMEYQMRNWYYFNWLCGDHICEQHIHNLDVANWFLNEYPETAQGMGGREIRKDKKFGEIFVRLFLVNVGINQIHTDKLMKQLLGLKEFWK